MTDTIVCAVDLSEATRAVFDTARWLADALHRRLVVVHIVDESAEDAEEVTVSVSAQLGVEPADVRVIEGSPAEAIMKTADRLDAELLVVGSRGRGGLRSAMLGSVSRELGAQARCPVVIVPPDGGRAAQVGAADRSDASVVCGVDGSEQALAAAAAAGRLANRLGLRPVVVHVLPNLKALMSYPGARSSTPPLSGQPDAVARLADEILDRAVEAADASASGIVKHGPPAEVLEAIADREGARLIVIAARGQGAVHAALLGSVAAQLTAAAARPVVVLSESAASTNPARP